MKKFLLFFSFLVACDSTITISKEVCLEGETQKCFISLSQEQDGIGECKSGQRTCQGGKWSGECLGEVLPVPDVCNGLDDDCDGSIDYNRETGVFAEFGQPCGPEEAPNGRKINYGVGECRSGKYTSCYSNRQGKDKPKFQLSCTGYDIGSDADICNGLDDDCDGVVDEYESGAPAEICYTPGIPNSSFLGECRPGIRYCANGAETACMGEILPRQEVCNGLDDDCDGVIDNGLGDPEGNLIFIVDVSGSNGDALNTIFDAMLDISCYDLASCPDVASMNSKFTYTLLLVGSSHSPGTVLNRVYYEIMSNAESRQKFHDNLNAARNYSKMYPGGVELYYETLRLLFLGESTGETELNIYNDRKKLIFMMGNEGGDRLNPLTQDEVADIIPRDMWKIYVFNEVSSYPKFTKIVGCENKDFFSCENYFTEWLLDGRLERKFLELMGTSCQ